MTTMRQCVLLEPGRLEIRDVPVPEPAAGEVVVRVRTALTCGTDLKAWRRGHPKMPPPTPFGHEFAGTVAVVGEEVTSFSVGDALMAANTGPCTACFWCRHDQENLCESIMEEMILGAYADYVRVPERVLRVNAYRKPQALPWAQAALLEPLASVCFGLTHLPANAVRDDALVVVVGAGPIAMLWVLALRAHGATRVVVAGRRPPRLEAARSLGAWRTLGQDDDVAAALADWSDGRGADAVIECTGLEQVWQRTPSLVRRGGHVVLFGGLPSGAELRIDPYRFHYDGVRLHSPFHFRPRDVAESHRLLVATDQPWSALVTSSHSLEDVPGLFERLGDGTDLKCAVIPQADGVED